MPKEDAQAPNPNAAPGIDFNQLIQLLMQLAPLIPVIVGSLAKKSAFAKAHGLKDPKESLMAFFDDYTAIQKAIAAIGESD